MDLIARDLSEFQIAAGRDDPELEHDALPQHQIMILEAIHVLTLGLEGAFASRSAIRWIMERWGWTGVRPSSVWALQRRDLVQTRNFCDPWKGRPWSRHRLVYDDWVVALTREGAIEHQAQRYRVFKPAAS